MPKDLREAAINRICELEADADDRLFGTPEPIRNAFRAGVEQGYDAGRRDAWVKVEDAKPIEGQSVLITFEGENGRYTQGGRYLQGFHVNNDAQHRFGDKLIAWMPLPAPYTQEGQDG